MEKWAYPIIEIGSLKKAHEKVKSKFSVAREYGINREFGKTSPLINFSVAVKSAVQYYFDFKDNPTWSEFYWSTLLVSISIALLTFIGEVVDLPWPLIGIVPIRYCSRLMDLVITIGFYQPERFRV